MGVASPEGRAAGRRQSLPPSRIGSAEALETELREGVVMSINIWKLVWVVAIVAVVFLAPAAVVAQDDDAGTDDTADDGTAVEEEMQTAGDTIVVVGSRSDEPRSVADSPVPIDVITSEDFRVMANEADITDNLKALVPSFTATRSHDERETRSIVCSKDSMANT